MTRLFCLIGYQHAASATNNRVVGHSFHVRTSPILRNSFDNKYQINEWFSPSMWREPEGLTRRRLLGLSTGLPFLYHLMRGGGEPRAWQERVATECRGSVWLVGRISTSGGGTSSTDVTCRPQDTSRKQEQCLK